MVAYCLGLCYKQVRLKTIFQQCTATNTILFLETTHGLSAERCGEASALGTSSSLVPDCGFLTPFHFGISLQSHSPFLIFKGQLTYRAYSWEMVQLQFQQAQLKVGKVTWLCISNKWGDKLHEPGNTFLPYLGSKSYFLLQTIKMITKIR